MLSAHIAFIIHGIEACANLKPSLLAHAHTAIYQQAESQKPVANISTKVAQRVSC
jgi:hypothetical protein